MTCLKKKKEKEEEEEKTLPLKPFANFPATKEQARKSPTPARRDSPSARRKVLPSSSPALPAPHAALQPPLLSARHRLPSPSPPCRCHWLRGGPPRRPSAVKVGSRARRGRSRGEGQGLPASLPGGVGGWWEPPLGRSTAAEWPWGKSLRGGGTFPVRQIRSLLRLWAASGNPWDVLRPWWSCGLLPAARHLCGAEGGSGVGPGRKSLSRSRHRRSYNAGSGSPAITPLACNAGMTLFL